jgi:phenylalanyl-tRNA synthetase beta chain
LRLFEIGSAFDPRGGRLPVEDLRVGALVMGRREPPHFTDPKSPEFAAWAAYDAWDVKALSATIAHAAYPGAEVEVVAKDEKDLWESLTAARGVHDDALWVVAVNGLPVGQVRRLTLDAPVWASPAFGVELSLGVMSSDDVAPAGKSAYRVAERRSEAGRRFIPLPSTPASEFDLALSVPDGVPAAGVEAVMRRVSGKLLESVELFDRYVGAGVEPGYRSLAWRLTFRHSERTLRDRELDARRSDILRALAELNVRQRAT